MKNRIKEIRTEVGKSQTDFAKKISVSRSAVCKMESGENLPSDQTIHLICKEFNVNEDWLRYGTGEMFVNKSLEQELIDFTADMLLGGDDFKKRLISGLAKLSDEQWDMLESLIDVISQQKRE